MSNRISSIFASSGPSDGTMGLHSLLMTKGLLSTISIIAHNGLNGLFVAP